MILGHYEIKKRLRKDLIVRPLDVSQVRENGIDLKIDEDLVIPAKGFELAKTKETLEFPVNLVGLCNLRSTYARQGLLIPPTIVDCGFKGKLVIEIANLTEEDRVLKKDARFLHLVVCDCEGGVEYRGTYQNQR